MKLHTLGPTGTDSQRAAMHFITTQKIVLHDSFEEIFYI